LRPDFDAANNKQSAPGERLARIRDEQRFILDVIILDVIAAVRCNTLAGLTFRNGRTFATGWCERARSEASGARSEVPTTASRMRNPIPSAAAMRRRAVAT
jgi:hypothetical protein